MTRTYHLSQSITGPLTNWDAADWKQACKYMTRNDGTKMTPEELRAAFVAELAQGHEVVPIGEACDNFDWKKGCQGHPKKEPTEPMP
jgi:hypothetical protein